MVPQEDSNSRPHHYESYKSNIPHCPGKSLIATNILNNIRYTHLSLSRMDCWYPDALVTMWSLNMIPIEQGGKARAIVRVTKRAVDQAGPLPKPYFVWDGELRGFGVRIDPGGAKTFAVRYRPKGHGTAAPKRFITIGRYGALTVDEARNRAKEILGAVAMGTDPAADLALRRAASTVRRSPTFSSKSMLNQSEKYRRRRVTSCC